MRALPFACLLLVLALLPATVAEAQRLISHDTLSGDSPVAITCGFCADEKYGVIFRELPAPARGIDPTDFPLIVNELRIAVASARVSGSSAVGYTCGGSITGGAATMDVEVYAGLAPPTGSIRTMPEVGEWPGESLVWAGSAPLTLSIADAEGSMRYEVNFNRLMVMDELDMPIQVDVPNTYLRVVVTLSSGVDTSQSCADLSLEPPSGFPVRDDDGLIADERAFIYAGGIGWFWNEEAPGAPIGGDWGVRMEIVSEGSPMRDAGTGSPDAGPTPDAGPADGGEGADAGTGGGDGGDDGCGCEAVGRAPTSGPWALFVIVGSVTLARRRMRRFR